MQTIQQKQDYHLLAGAIMLLSLAACGGASSEEKTIREACAANAAVSKDYCDCYSESLTGELEKADLKAYAGLMKKALDAQSGDEQDFQQLFAQAMAGGFDDPQLSMRIGMAAQEAAQTCMSER